MTLNLKKEKKILEECLGEIPKGICICEDNSGGISLIGTSEVNREEKRKFYIKLINSDKIKSIPGKGNLRKQCTGNYLKIKK